MAKNKVDRDEYASELRKSIDIGPLAECVGFYIKRVQEHDFAQFMECVPDPNVTPARFTVLTIIDNNPGLTQANLAKVLGIARSGVAAMLKPLQLLGYITQDVADDDKRTIRLSITPVAKLALKSITREILESDKELTSNLTLEERKHLMHLLAKMLPHSVLRP